MVVCSPCRVRLPFRRELEQNRDLLRLDHSLETVLQDRGQVVVTGIMNSKSGRSESPPAFVFWAGHRTGG